MLKQKIKSSAKNVKFRLSKIPVIIWIIGLSLVVITGYVLGFIVPKNIDFAYAESRYCIGSLTLLPELHQQTSGTNFKLQAEGGAKLGSLYLFSSQICLEPVVAPTSGNTAIAYSPFGGPIFRRNYNVTVGPRPRLNVKLDQPIALAKPLVFTLNQPDNIFGYQIKIDQKTSACQSKSSKISCDLKPLSLTQGQKYAYNLTRTFNKTDASNAITGDLTLLSPTGVTNTSIKAGEVVYSKPKSFTFETDKKLIAADVGLEKIDNNKPTKLASTLKVTGSTVEASIVGDLERNANYRLTLDKAEAADGSMLAASVVTNFQTSGGPIVSGVNIASSGIDANAKVVVTFDQAISQTQDIAKLANLIGGNATISRTANQVIFQLRNLPICGAFSLNIAKGLNSQYDIASKDGWSYSSRINCRSSEVIGYSVLGRPIVAYSYGNGPTTILFTGGIHGTEQSGKYIMQDWVSHLDTNAYKIPADRRVVVVPTFNPDGLATSTRYNANNVNLDTNFGSANWVSDIHNASGTLLVGGGGSSAMSEPESKALASLTIRLHPRLEVSFHAQGRLVGANQQGDSTAIGNLYATSVGYTSMIGHAEETMGYAITGEYEEWAGEQYGIPAILIELPGMTGRYFGAHQSTLWKMVNI